MCALFLGSEVVLKKENIQNLHPIMIMKSIVETLICFLLEHNPWYSKSGIKFSPDNLRALYDEVDANDNEQYLPAAMDLCHLSHEGCNNDPVGPGGGYAERDMVFEDGEGDDVVMEAVGYTTGDYSPRNYHIMKATALAWCLDGLNQLIVPRDLNR
jgi:hypothetical protein